MNWSIVNLGQTASVPIEPISLQEAKDWLRIDHSDEDALLSALITSATLSAESFTGRAIMSQSFRLNLDCFPEIITLPMAPLISVTSVKYLDESGVLQTMNSADYEVDSASFPARIVPAYATSWPTHRHTINSVRVEFVAGYGESQSDVPQTIRDAILVSVTDRFEHRGSDGALSSVSQLLLTPYKTWYSTPR